VELQALDHPHVAARAERERRPIHSGVRSLL
jgi:hypothetical protein